MHCSALYRIVSEHRRARAASEPGVPPRPAQYSSTANQSGVLPGPAWAAGDTDTQFVISV